MSLLNKLKSQASATPVSTATTDKRPSHILDADFFKAHGFDDAKALEAKSNEDLAKLAYLDAQIKTLTGQMDTLKSRVNGYAKQAFLDTYQDLGRQPENFKILSADGKSSAMFVAQDKYTGKDFQAIAAVCPELVVNGLKVEVNIDMLEKYDTAISKFIATCPEIADEDREKIFTATPQVRILKGAIENLSKYATSAKVSVSEIFEMIRPVSFCQRFTTTAKK